MICERCGKEHDGSYGSGRFCGKECSHKRQLSLETRKIISEKVKKFYENNSDAVKRHGWSKQARENGNKRNVEKALQKNLNYLSEGKYELLSKNFRRKILLEEAKYACEVCHNNQWLGKQIWLEIHHKDDDGKNNKRDNLIVVCPNCHSVLDPNYRFRGREHSSE